MSKNQGQNILLGLSVVLIAVLFLVPAIPQDQTYHQFADQEPLFGIPHFWNVVSNIFFIVIGSWAMWLLCVRGNSVADVDVKKYVFLFCLGFFLTGFGSAFYHWSPSNETLVWDRLPMTIAFMAFFSMMLAIHAGKYVGSFLLWPMLLTGVFSVSYWSYTERVGQGDLRLYAGVQFIPIILIPAMIFLLPKKAYQAKYFWFLVVAYVSAKLFEHFDKEIYRAILMSGHAIKHVVASLSGIAFFYLVKSYNPGNDKN